MKYILLSLLLLSKVCHGMEPEDFNNVADLNAFEKHMIKNLTGASLFSLSSQGSILELGLPKRLSPKKPARYHYKARFIKNYSKNGVIYLTPLYEDTQEQMNLESSAWNYRLLLLAEGGHAEMIDETLKYGANPIMLDKRLPRPLFNLSTQALGTPLYTHEDLQRGALPFRLLQSARPVIAVHPYSSTYNFTSIDHAVRQCSLSTLELLQKTCEDALPDDVLKRIHYNIKLNELMKELDEEQRAIQWAQAHAAIPTFHILPDSKSTDSYFSWIISEDDPELRVRTQIDKDTCIVEFHSNPALWKTQRLDLDALSTLYAHVILNNETEGTRVLNHFDAWSKYSLFTMHVIRYALDNLERESYDDQRFLPENITQFAKRVARYTNDIQKRINPLQSEHLVGMTLCVCAAKLSKPSDKGFEWYNATDALVKTLTSEPVTEQLCKKICDNNKPLFFVPAIKFSMQIALLQRYCARILSGAEPHLDTALIERILSYWQPNSKFVSAIKKYKVDSKIGSIKKAFHAIIDKK